jgi:2-polyprenyl-3-methyl-5-hydroxy-6-metoxy-1,4-benzoquinol methylase
MNLEHSPITPGQVARRILGRHFEPVGNVYRRIFVDLDKIAVSLSALIPDGARVLDIGGGDGALVERLLDRRPDLTVAMCDLAPAIGSFLSDANRAKVHCLPATDFSEVDGEFDVVTLSDVVHHIPVAQRESFFELLAQHCTKWGCRNLIVKDIEPGGPRAALAKWTDWYISGERQVVPFSRANLAAIGCRYFPGSRPTSDMPDKPNYCELLSW